MVRSKRASASKAKPKPKSKPLPAESSSELSAPPTDDELDSQVFNTQTLAQFSADSQSQSQSQPQSQLQAVDEEEEEEQKETKKSRKRGRKEVEAEEKKSGVKKARKQIFKKEEEEEEKEPIAAESKAAKTVEKAAKGNEIPKRKQPARAKKQGGMPLAARTPGLRMLVGAHVSMAKGVQNSVTNSLNIGGNAFALFLKSQRKWVSPALKEADIKAFREMCRAHGYDPMKHILPHGSYLINLAQSDNGKAMQAYDAFLDDLKRCEQLGIGLYNFHPGSTLGHSRDKALTRIATALNRAHEETTFVRTVLENMAGQGNVVGNHFEDLRDIISQVKDKSRVGVCLDTCHLFAAGHEIRTEPAYNATISNFDRIVGLKYLSAMHLNDSKGDLGEKRDLHQNIGLGFLGLEPFRIIMNDKRLEGIPLILETPMENEQVWADEVKLLESLIGKGPEDEEFVREEERLAKLGKARIKDWNLEKKIAKEKAKRKRGKGRKEDSTSESESEYDMMDLEWEHMC